MNFEEAVHQAAKIIAESRLLVALTGAGISAESGIPTFRGKDGLWSKYRPEDLATPEAFARNPELVWKWYRWRMEIVFRARPNAGHIALAELERMGVLKCVITQNVDGLHQEAGSKCVIELHGSIRRVRCSSCGYRQSLTEPPQEIPPRCPCCGSLLRPDVVWFGEPLPEDAWRRAVELCEQADAMLVVGTSGVVMPAGYLPYIVKRGGGKVIEVNIEPSAITSITDVFVSGKAGRALPAIVEYVRELKERRV